MAGEDRTALHHLSWLSDVERDPGAFDFHVVLRRLESIYRDRPRLGTALRPSDEPVRLGQEPSMAFAPSAISAFRKPDEGHPARLDVAFTGMFGPHGPLPLHITEYARDRIRNSGDATFARFVDMLQHRMLLLFHRAWSEAQLTASGDRPESNRFNTYVGALFGVALHGDAHHGGVFDDEKLFYAGRFALRVRNPEGIRAVLADYLGLPVAIEEFVGEWVDLSPVNRWHLGHGPEVSMLGRTTVAGARVFCRDQKFRVILGPLARDDFEDMLPGAPGLRRLSAVVRDYVGDELKWDVRLVRKRDVGEETRLGQHGRLGWTTRLGASTAHGATDLIVDASTNRTVRARSAPFENVSHNPSSIRS